MSPEELKLYLEFNHHREQLEKETAFLSSSTKMVENEHHKAIVDMGIAVVPFLIDEMKLFLFSSQNLYRQVGNPHLCSALRMITGEWPIDKKYAGNMTKIADGWVVWSKKDEEKPEECSHDRVYHNSDLIAKDIVKRISEKK